MANSKFNFHYTPTGTGVISGPEVLRQTEDAINDIGAYAEQASDNSGLAVETAKEAKAIAETANGTSSNALAIANATNEKVETLKQVVADFEPNIQKAVTDAQNALSVSNTANVTAQEAQTKSEQAKQSAERSELEAQNASNQAATSAQEAETAKQAALEAKNQAETAQGQAEIAQNQAQEARETAEEATKSAYALRIYEGELSISQTLNTTELKPQGNIKIGDTVVGIDGRIFQIASVNNSAGTVTLGSTWTDLTPTVSYQVSQQLTTEQQETARNNINALSPDRANLLYDKVPAGSLINFAGTKIPKGYLLCNGAAVSRTTYADLFAAIGTLYGAGDGSTTFNLPNAHHLFLEATTTLSEVGQNVKEGVPNATGSLSAVRYNRADNEGDVVTEGAITTIVEHKNCTIADGNTFGSVTYYLDASKSSAKYGASETIQPHSIRTFLFIRY